MKRLIIKLKNCKTFGELDGFHKNVYKFLCPYRVGKQWNNRHHGRKGGLYLVYPPIYLRILYHLKLIKLKFNA